MRVTVGTRTTRSRRSWTTVAWARKHLAGADIEECIRGPEVVIAIRAIQGHTASMSDARDDLDWTLIPEQGAKDLFSTMGSAVRTSRASPLPGSSPWASEVAASVVIAIPQWRSRGAAEPDLGTARRGGRRRGRRR